MDHKMREWFRVQGRIGGKKRVAALSGAERSALAQIAAKARWGWRDDWRYKLETAIHGSEVHAAIRAWQPGESPRRDPGMVICQFQSPTVQHARVLARLFFRHWLRSQMPRRKRGGTGRPKTPGVVIAATSAQSCMKSKATTRIGYLNRNSQEVIRATNLPGTDHMQRIYVLSCRRSGCGFEYGANGSDLWQRRCPNCQGGMPGLPTE